MCVGRNPQEKTTIMKRECPKERRTYLHKEKKKTVITLARALQYDNSGKDNTNPNYQTWGGGDFDSQTNQWGFRNQRKLLTNIVVWKNGIRTIGGGGGNGQSAINILGKGAVPIGLN